MGSPNFGQAYSSYVQTFADIPNVISAAYQRHDEEQLRKLHEVETLKQELSSYKEALEKANATIKEARSRLEQAETEKARLRKLLADNGVITMDDSS